MTFCECDHPASSHVLGGPCEECLCESFIPNEWEDEEADTNDFGGADRFHIAGRGDSLDPWFGSDDY